jgi:CBS domain-containing protein
MPLPQVLHVFTEHDYLCYPVIDVERRLKGLVSFQQIKDTLTSGPLQSLLLAHDIMRPATITTTPEAPLKDALDQMTELNIEEIAVTSPEADGRLVGFLDRAVLMHHITSEITRRREKMSGSAGS